MLLSAVVLLGACGGSDADEAGTTTVQTTGTTAAAAATETTTPETFVVECDDGFSAEIPRSALTEEQAEIVFCTPTTTAPAPWEPDPDLLVSVSQSTWPSVFGAVSGDAIVGAGQALCTMATDAPDATAFGGEALEVYEAGFAQFGADVFGPDDWSMFSIASLSTLCRPEMNRLYR